MNRRTGKTALIIILCVVGFCVVSAGAVGVVAFLQWDRLPPGWKMDDQPQGSKVEFPKHNFSFTVPFGKWTRLKPDKLNNLAVLAYGKGKRQIFFMLIAEAVDPDVPITDELLSSVVKNNLRGAAKSSRILDERPETLHALDGVALEAEAHVQGFHAHYRYWVGTVNGYVYQLICWGHRKRRAEVNREAETIFRNFAILDYQKFVGDP